MQRVTGPSSLDELKPGDFEGGCKLPDVARGAVEVDRSAAPDDARDVLRQVFDRAAAGQLTGLDRKVVRYDAVGDRSGKRELACRRTDHHLVRREVPRKAGPDEKPGLHQVHVHDEVTLNGLAFTAEVHDHGRHRAAPDHSPGGTGTENRPRRVMLRRRVSWIMGTGLSSCHAMEQDV